MNTRTVALDAAPAQVALSLHLPLSCRQKRAWKMATRNRGLDWTALAVMLPKALPAADCLAALQSLSGAIDSLRCDVAVDGDEPQWRTIADAVPLRAVASAATSLADFVDELSHASGADEALQPLTVSHREFDAAHRLWLLAAGAARCDLTGLELLAGRWAAQLSGVTSSIGAMPPMGAVYRALDRATETNEARSTRAYWNGHSETFARPANLADSHACRPRAVKLKLVDDALASAAARFAVSPRSVLAAAWMLLLGRVTSATRVGIGVRFDGRVAPGLDGFIGHLAHYAPLERTLQRDESVESLIRDLHRTLSLHHRLQDSFSWDASLESARVGSEGFDFQFAFRDVRSIGGDAAIVDGIEGGEPLCLRLVCNHLDQTFPLTLFYDAATIRAEQAQYLARRLVVLVERIGAASLISDAALWNADDAQYAALLRSECGDSRPEWVEHDRLDELLLAGMATCRIRDPAASASGAEILERVQRRKELLLLKCASPQRAMIALALPNSLEATLTTLAALLAGIPLTFMDDGWSVERKRTVVELVGATLLIAAQPIPELAASVCILSPQQLSAEESHLDRASTTNCSPDDVAYAVFTSGSSGVPRPILIQRRALQNQLSWLQERLPIHSADVVLHRTPLGFDAAIWEMLHPLCAGATLVIPPPEMTNDGASIVAAIERNGATIVQLTPHLLRAVVRELESKSLDTLRLVVCGGDRLLHKLAAKVTGDFAFTLVNAYGPSECCIQVTIGDVDGKALSVEAQSASIGAPMPNAGLHILSEAMDCVLDGHIGHLYISGVPVGHGYAGDAGATAQTFVPLATSTDPGRRTYRTGDLARRGRDGSIEIVGRADREEKLNGVRVDLRAVERQLQSMAEVEEARAVAIKDEYGVGYVVAVIVAHGEPGAVRQTARQLLGATLPPAFQPAHYVCLERLPITERGKLDVDVLKESILASGLAAAVAPRTPVEHAIAEVWKTLLNRESIGVHEDFFLAGGHSLLFAQAITRLRESLCPQIPLRAIFTHPTIAQLAAYIEELLEQQQRA